MDEMALSLGVAGAWTVFRLIGDWILFQKAGKPGWHSIIPILHMYDEYDHSLNQVRTRGSKPARF